MTFISAYMLTIYRRITLLAAPLVCAYLTIRKWRGKEDGARLRERFGHASGMRPAGPLIWLHAASIGEAMSLLKLMDAIHQRAPQVQILLTTGTVTSARLLVDTLPGYVTHQFTPVDTPQSIQRFLTHWQPSIVVFTESELWPNMILEAAVKGVKLALINARMSEKSFTTWQYLPEMIRTLLSHFSWIAAQTRTDAERYTMLGANQVLEFGNLKHDAEALACDEHLLQKLKSALAGRPCVVAASLHPGEDEGIAETHQQLTHTFPTLLTIIVPRHPERGAEMAQSAKAVTAKIARRSEGRLPDAEAEIFIADSIGELGLWYRLADVVVMGGSFIAHGGQNPLEPARLGRGIVVGPHMFNFAEITAQLLTENGLIQVNHMAELAPELSRLLHDKQARTTLANNARTWLASKPPVADVLADKLLALAGLA